MVTYNSSYISSFYILKQETFNYSFRRFLISYIITFIISLKLKNLFVISNGEKKLLKVAKKFH